MKYIVLVFTILLFAFPSFGHGIILTGVVYDPGGAVVVNAEIQVVDEGGFASKGKTDSEGIFSLELIPGIYELEVSAPGFLTVKHAELFVVNSTNGKMAMDFVLFGSKFHEPCGYSGADCLPAKKLIKSYELKYSPKLKEIREIFAPDTKIKENKTIRKNK